MGPLSTQEGLRPGGALGGALGAPAGPGSLGVGLSGVAGFADASPKLGPTAWGFHLSLRKNHWFSQVFCHENGWDIVDISGFS